MAKLLADFGFAEVYSVDGGFEAWRQTLPITVAAPPATAAAPETNLAAWLKAQGFGENLEASFHGVTPLIKASQMGLSEVVEELLAAGAQLTSVDAYGNDALWAACFSGDLPTLDVLIRAGIALDRQNPSGNTSLIHAASAGKTAVVECLLQAGADPHIENQDGYSALELAANLPVLKLLRGLGQKTVDSAPPPPAHAPSGDGLRL
jgi:ankyrin repeat protein